MDNSLGKGLVNELIAEVDFGKPNRILIYRPLECRRRGHGKRNLISEGKGLTRFAGEISASASGGNKLVDLTQDLLGSHQTELIRLR